MTRWAHFSTLEKVIINFGLNLYLDELKGKDGKHGTNPVHHKIKNLTRQLERQCEEGLSCEN